MSLFANRLLCEGFDKLSPNGLKMSEREITVHPELVEGLQ
jgi:hypothetical protein